jgi:hypothetical protein
MVAKIFGGEKEIEKTETGKIIAEHNISNLVFNMVFKIIYWFYFIGNMWLSFLIIRLTKKGAIIYSSASLVIFLIIGYFFIF